jgi:hypothetical protein
LIPVELPVVSCTSALASIMPEEALLHADAVVAGEAEEVWPQVIADNPFR